MSTFLYGSNGDSLDHSFDNRPIIYFHGGISMPVGDFGANKDVRNSDGFAENGRSIGLGFILPLAKGINLDLGYSNRSYSIDRVSFDKITESEFKSNSTVPITNQFKYTSDFGSYQNSNITAGFKIDANINEQFQFFFTPAVAFSWLKVPDVGIGVKDSLFEITSKQSSERTFDVSFSLELGAIYQISEDLGLSLKMDYIKALHETEVVVNTDSNLTGSTTETLKENIDYSALTFSLAIYFRLK